MIGHTNYSEGGQFNKAQAPSATYGGGVTGYTAEAKAAEKFVGVLDKMSFDTIMFAHAIVSTVGFGPLRRRILDVAINIIKTYAIQWESGVSQDEVARDAMRLKDTCDKFKM